MLTIVRTKWHDDETSTIHSAIMLVDFDTDKIRDEDEAARAIRDALYECAKSYENENLNCGDLIDLLDDKVLAKHGAKIIEDDFMIVDVDVDGCDHPLTTYDPPEGMNPDAPAPKTGVDENGLSLAIEFHVLPEADMLSAGFRIPYENADNYYRFQWIKYGVSLNVTVPKDGSRGRIDVIDEEICQPYDYQYILAHHPDNPFASQVKAYVENEMEKLVAAGVLSGWKRGDYI